MDKTTEDYETTLDLCCDRYCRIILAVLAGQRRTVTVRELLNGIVEHDPELVSAELTDADVEGIRRDLYHIHIPKLTDVSVIEYDRNYQLVKPTTQFDQLRPYLSAIIDTDPNLENATVE